MALMLATKHLRGRVSCSRLIVGITLIVVATRRCVHAICLIAAVVVVIIILAGGPQHGLRAAPWRLRHNAHQILQPCALDELTDESVCAGLLDT